MANVIMFLLFHMYSGGGTPTEHHVRAMVLSSSVAAFRVMVGLGGGLSENRVDKTD